MLNKVQLKSVEVTPYEIWTNKKPYLSYMKVWGCPTYVKRTITDKLEARYDKCLFIGYPKKNKRISILQHFGTKVVCFKAYCLLRERVSLERRQWEQSGT